MQLLAEGQLLPGGVPGVDENYLAHESPRLGEEHPEEDVLQVRPEDREQGYKRQDAEYGDEGARREDQDQSRGPALREPVVFGLLGEHAHVLAGGGNNQYAGDERGGVHVRLPDHAHHDFPADPRDVEVAYRHALPFVLTETRRGSWRSGGSRGSC